MQNDPSHISILGVPGSLRAGSWNKKLLAAAATLLPPDTSLVTFTLEGIQPYDEDVRERGFPPAVEAFRAAIARADAVLFVTPEYNYSVPGLLKNAIDWASRPPSQPFLDKPVATLGASTSIHGTVRGQTHLRQVCVGLGMFVLPKPEVYVAKAPEKFDATGALTDEDTKKRVTELVANLASLARKLRAR